MLPAFDLSTADSVFDAGAAYLRQLLTELEPALEERIVAIARRPGVQSKVAITDVERLSDLGAVRAQLDGERIDVVPFSTDAHEFIAQALGLAEPPPIVLQPTIRHARVWLGDVDVRGMEGWRGINRLLASAVTGWRIHLLPVTQSAGWQVLANAQRARRTIIGTALRASTAGWLVDVHGLHALLHTPQPLTPGQELELRVVRMNPDEGRIVVSQHLAPSGQLGLALFGA
jgi:hypothetical protein